MMSLTSPVSCVSDDFSFYGIICFLIFRICCHWTNHIHLMMNLTVMGLTPDPLVRTLIAIFLCLLTNSVGSVSGLESGVFAPT